MMSWWNLSAVIITFGFYGEMVSLCRCPFYYHVKFVFLVWLQLPSSSVSYKGLILTSFFPLPNNHKVWMAPTVKGKGCCSSHSVVLSQERNLSVSLNQFDLHLLGRCSGGTFSSVHELH
jgi:hypothetical protein